jgi:hypothetical protein
VQKVVGSSPTILKLDIEGIGSVGNDVAAQWQPTSAIGG